MRGGTAATLTKDLLLPRYGGNLYSFDTDSRAVQLPFIESRVVPVRGRVVDWDQRGNLEYARFRSFFPHPAYSSEFLQENILPITHRSGGIENLCVLSGERMNEIRAHIVQVLNQPLEIVTPKFWEAVLVLFALNDGGQLISKLRCELVEADELL